jgi:hypothetical protein
MSSQPPGPLFPAVCGLLAFWWCVFSLWGIYQAGWTLPPGWLPALKAHLFWWCFWALAGCILTIAWVWAKRQWKLANLEGEVWRDFSWSIGPFPVKLVPPPAVKRFSGDIRKLSLPDQVRNSPWHTRWREIVLSRASELREAPQRYIDVLEALWRVLEFHEHVPAGVVPGAPDTGSAKLTWFQRWLFRNVQWRSLPGWYIKRVRAQVRRNRPSQAPRHGDYTLFEHSYITAWAMTEIAKTWSYEKAQLVWSQAPLTYLMRDRVKFDRSYKFDPLDPMIPILGLAHDLGKFKTYDEILPGVWQSNGRKHARESSLTLSRLDEWWELPAEEKLMTNIVLEAYHCPRKLKRKISPDAEDDRNFCLAMLLIEADKLALSLQGSTDLDSEEEEVQGSAGRSARDEGALAPILTPQEEERVVWDAFMATLRERGAVTQANAPRSLGQRVHLEVVLDQGGKTSADVVIVSLRQALSALRWRMSKDHRANFSRPGNAGAMRRALFKSLMRANLLVTALPNHKLDPEKDMWGVSWRRELPGGGLSAHSGVGEKSSLILLAGGPLLHVGVSEEGAASPLVPSIVVRPDVLGKMKAAPKSVAKSSSHPSPKVTRSAIPPPRANQGQQALPEGAPAPFPRGSAPLDSVSPTNAPGTPPADVPPPDDSNPLDDAGAHRGEEQEAEAISERDIATAVAAATEIVTNWINHCPDLGKYQIPPAPASASTYRVPSVTVAFADPYLKNFFKVATCRVLKAGHIPFAHLEGRGAGAESILVIDRGAFVAAATAAAKSIRTKRRASP